MISAKLSSLTLLFNLLKIAASKKKVRENVTSAPTSQVGQRRQANWCVGGMGMWYLFCGLTSLKGILPSVGWRHNRGYLLCGMPSYKAISPSVGWRHERRIPPPWADDDCCVFKLLRGSVNRKHLMCFQSGSSVFKYSCRSVEGEHLICFQICPA